MSGRPTADRVRAWADEVDAVGERIGRHFARSEPRRRAVGYVRGLLGDAERKNGWPAGCWCCGRSSRSPRRWKPPLRNRRPDDTQATFKMPRRQGAGDTPRGTLVIIGRALDRARLCPSAFV